MKASEARHIVDKLIGERTNELFVKIKKMAEEGHVETHFPMDFNVNQEVAKGMTDMLGDYGYSVYKHDQSGTMVVSW